MNILVGLRSDSSKWLRSHFANLNFSMLLMRDHIHGHAETLRVAPHCIALQR